MDIKKALFISQEIHPYLNPTPVSTICREVPQGLQEKGVEVRTFMPKYGCINERRNQLHEVIRLSGLNIIIDDSDHPLIIKVATLQPTRLQVYFIDNDDFFHHHATEQLEIDAYPQDNDERIIFYSLGVIETVRKLRWFPQIIQCNGWITSLCPLFIKTKYLDDPAFTNSKMVYGIYEDKFEGELDARMPEKLKMMGLTDDDLKAILDGPIDYKALSRLAIDHCDAIVQCMETVDPEILEYAKASGKPFMPYAGDNNAAAYLEFYETL
ncbi:MAG: glycogen/starch synthase [Bacteroidales bacterium]|nr:glycogen/starch synthase [Bacteroidales bacterium]